MATDDIEWDNLENEDALTGIGSSLKALGPFPFHGGEGTSGEPMEAGCTVVPPQKPIEVCGSTVTPEEPKGVGRSASVLEELPGVSPSAQEQRAGSKQPRSDEAEHGSGVHPPNASAAQRR